MRTYEAVEPRGGEVLGDAAVMKANQAECRRVEHATCQQVSSCNGIPVSQLVTG